MHQQSHRVLLKTVKDNPDTDRYGEIGLGHAGSFVGEVHDMKPRLIFEITCSFLTPHQVLVSGNRLAA